jgi:hypothetical protein
MISDTPNPVLDARNASSDSVRIWPLVFRRGPDVWRLVRVYRGT